MNQDNNPGSWESYSKRVSSLNDLWSLLFLRFGDCDKKEKCMKNLTKVVFSFGLVWVFLTKVFKQGSIGLPNAGAPPTGLDKLCCLVS